ncbi:uncharacterized protein SEPMUDRAFT_146972, partial [Sphaerulina musiva SO2202]
MNQTINNFKQKGRRLPTPFQEPMAPTKLSKGISKPPRRRQTSLKPLPSHAIFPTENTPSKPFRSSSNSNNNTNITLRISFHKGNFSHWNPTTWQPHTFPGVIDATKPLSDLPN